MVISSRTPEGEPGRCPVCGASTRIEPSDPAGDAPCPSCGHLVWFSSETAGDELVIQLTGPSVVHEQIRGLIDLFAATTVTRIALDLARVEHLNSASLAALLDWRKRTRNRRGDLVLRRVHPDLLEVFRITRLDLVFTIEA